MKPLTRCRPHPALEAIGRRRAAALPPRPAASRDLARSPLPARRTHAPGLAARPPARRSCTPASRSPPCRIPRGRSLIPLAPTARYIRARLVSVTSGCGLLFRLAPAASGSHLEHEVDPYLHARSPLPTSRVRSTTAACCLSVAAPAARRLPATQRSLLVGRFSTSGSIDAVRSYLRCGREPSERRVAAPTRVYRARRPQRGGRRASTAARAGHHLPDPIGSRSMIPSTPHSISRRPRPSLTVQGITLRPSCRALFRSSRSALAWLAPRSCRP